MLMLHNPVRRWRRRTQWNEKCATNYWMCLPLLHYRHVAALAYRCHLGSQWGGKMEIWWVYLDDHRAFIWRSQGVHITFTWHVTWFYVTVRCWSCTALWVVDVDVAQNSVRCWCIWSMSYHNPVKRELQQYQNYLSLLSLLRAGTHGRLI